MPFFVSSGSVITLKVFALLLVFRKVISSSFLFSRNLKFIHSLEELGFINAGIGSFKIHE